MFKNVSTEDLLKLLFREPSGVKMSRKILDIEWKIRAKVENKIFVLDCRLTTQLPIYKTVLAISQNKATTFSSLNSTKDYFKNTDFRFLKRPRFSRHFIKFRKSIFIN